MMLRWVGKQKNPKRQLSPCPNVDDIILHHQAHLSQAGTPDLRLLLVPQTPNPPNLALRYRLLLRFELRRLQCERKPSGVGLRPQPD